MKAGAIAILTAMILGILSWFGNQVISNSHAIESFRQKEKSFIYITKDFKQMINKRLDTIDRKIDNNNQWIRRNLSRKQEIRHD